jgi:hypothetical protein
MRWSWRCSWHGTAIARARPVGGTKAVVAVMSQYDRRPKARHAHGIRPFHGNGISKTSYSGRPRPIWDTLYQADHLLVSIGFWLMPEGYLFRKNFL